MKSSYSVFMQSRYFDPMFNSAVFDGPFRIYFNQMHESLALKIYFLLNQKLNDISTELREFSRRTDGHIFILLYPNVPQFQHVFAKTDVNTANFAEVVASEPWEQDLVFGLARPLEDEELVNLVQQIRTSVQDWMARGIQNETNPEESVEFSEQITL